MTFDHGCVKPTIAIESDAIGQLPVVMVTHGKVRVWEHRGAVPYYLWCFGRSPNRRQFWFLCG